MKAGVLERIECLNVQEVEDPRLEHGSIILKVRACSICSTDIRIFHYGHPRVRLPHVLGHEIAGEIVAIGEGVQGYAVGDRVAVTPTVACGQCFYCRRGQPVYCQRRKSFGYQMAGGYAEYLYVPPEAVVYGALNQFPPSLSFLEASLAEPLACCLRAQRTSGVSAGMVVAVIGGGPVGIMHARLARAAGAGSVILVERDPSRLVGRDLDSVSVIVDSSWEDPEAAIASRTEGRGVDVVIVACSSGEAQAQSLRLAGSGGRVNFFGGLPPENPHITVDSNLIHYKEISVQGAHGSTPQDNREALDVIASGRVIVRDLISHTFPLESIVEAFRFAESRAGMHVAVCP